MRKIKKSYWVVNNIVMYFWEIVQNIVGFTYWFFGPKNCKVITTNNGETKKVWFRELVRNNKEEAVTIGEFIFLDDQYQHDGWKYALEACYKHEYGHVVQSRILGPLWLLIIGVPSLIHACLYRENKTYNYYDFYTERWANTLSSNYFVE